MSKLSDLSTNIDSRIKNLAMQIPNYAGKDSLLAQLLDLLTQKIDEYRGEAAKEIEGLKSDVRSAESAYEREKVRADGLEQEKDRWTNECLPGWRKRVSESERKERETRAAYESNVREVQSIANVCQQLEEQVSGLQVKLANANEWRFGIDSGSPEGDKTVVSWKCACGTPHAFEPPRSSYWPYSSECSTCGSRISLSPLSV